MKSSDHISTLKYKINASLYRATKMCRWIRWKRLMLCLLNFRETDKTLRGLQIWSSWHDEHKKKLLPKSKPGPSACSHSPITEIHHYCAHLNVNIKLFINSLCNIIKECKSNRFFYITFSCLKINRFNRQQHVLHTNSGTLFNSLNYVST